ncbi:MAG TPA: DUF2303 family protein [Hyphomonas sp.]|nr:DUF2303 family protein [Hyphomonas sp.]
MSNTSNTPEKPSEVREIASLAALAAHSKTAHVTADRHNIDYIIVPEGAPRAEYLDHHKPKPIRLKGKVHIENARSFHAYLRRYLKVGNTAVFINSPQNTPPVMTAIMDYHAGYDDPNWRWHWATWPLKFSRPFETWRGHSGQTMSQMEFALFIEENLPEIAEPDAATMLELVLNFQAARDVTFTKLIRLSNGSVQANYSEEVRGGARSSNLNFPESMVLKLPIFVDDEPIKVQVRLRWRLSDGGVLKLSYEIIRIGDVVDRATAAHIDKLRTNFPEIDIYECPPT